MKAALGDLLDPCTLQAMEVSAAMAAAGASQVATSLNFFFVADGGLK
jgi:hypothetical protein